MRQIEVDRDCGMLLGYRRGQSARRGDFVRKLAKLLVSEIAAVASHWFLLKPGRVKRDHRGWRCLPSNEALSSSAGTGWHVHGISQFSERRLGRNFFRKGIYGFGSMVSAEYSLCYSAHP